MHAYLGVDDGRVRDLHLLGVVYDLTLKLTSCSFPRELQGICSCQVRLREVFQQAGPFAESTH